MPELSRSVRTAYLGLGSSLGDRREHLRRALRALNAPGAKVRVRAVSPIYESPHLGLQAGDAERFPPHLNCVARIETTLEPLELLAATQAVETLGQRQRDTRWGPRTIDIDILLYGALELRSARLILPHPGLAERAFVVRPLADLAPDLGLPDGRRVGDLAASEAICAQRLERIEGEANDLLL